MVMAAELILSHASSFHTSSHASEDCSNKPVSISSCWAIPAPTERPRATETAVPGGLELPYRFDRPASGWHAFAGDRSPEVNWYYIPHALISCPGIKRLIRSEDRPFFRSRLQRCSVEGLRVE